MKGNTCVLGLLHSRSLKKNNTRTSAYVLKDLCESNTCACHEGPLREEILVHVIKVTAGQCRKITGIKPKYIAATREYHGIYIPQRNNLPKQCDATLC